MRAALILGLLLVAPALVSAQDTGWTIDRFHADYTVRSDRKIDVVERIGVDFRALRRHGIYREIVTRYQRTATAGIEMSAGRVTVDLDVTRVVDEAGRDRPFVVHRERDRVRIRIGDPNRTVTGRQTYEIRYTLERGVGFFDTFDELYWQVTGTEWPVPIARASATVSLPGDASQARSADEPWAATCYSGWWNSSDSSRCTASYDGAGRYRFGVDRLEAGQGLTFAATFPKGVIAPPSLIERLLNGLLAYGPLLLPLFALAVMLYHWREQGRDPETGSIVATWDLPEGLRPGPAGALVDQRVDMRDVIATILDLAVRGHIEIRETPWQLIENLDRDSFTGRALRAMGLDRGDWELIRHDRPDENLKIFERLIVTGLFEKHDTRKLSDLHNEFYKFLSEIRQAMFVELVNLGYFPESPNRVRVRYRWAGVAIGIVGFGFGWLIGHMVLQVGALFSGAIVLAFAGVMPRVTPAGARRVRELRGLEEYIRRAEKAEIEFRNAPEKTPELFETILPYAVALDATDIWIEQFEDLFIEPRSWYTTRSGTWSANDFRTGLGSFESAATRTLGSAPGSSSGGGGGGSVGGGGGGGGGGSW